MWPILSCPLPQGERAQSRSPRLRRVSSLVRRLALRLGAFAGLEVVALDRPLGFLAVAMRPLAELVAVPGHARLERRQAKLLPNLTRLLHVLLGRQRHRRIVVLAHGVD